MNELKKQMDPNMIEKIKMDLQNFNDLGLLSKGTTLSYKSGGASFTALPGLQSTPEVGGDPEQVEVTDLSDSKKRYIKGLQDVDALEFGFLYDAATFSTLENLANSDAVCDFELKFPDNSKFTFRGKVNTKMGAAEVNGALVYTLSVVVQSGPDFAPGA